MFRGNWPSAPTSGTASQAFTLCSVDRLLLLGDVSVSEASPVQQVTTNEDETVAFGRRLATVLRPADVVAIDGELGTGKTRLVRGLVAGLGGDPAIVTSPTFTLLHEYATDPPLTHADAYRLADSDEFLALGVSELWEDGIVAVEWASRVADALPRRTIWIEGHIESETRRVFRITVPEDRRDAVAVALATSDGAAAD